MHSSMLDLLNFLSFYVGECCISLNKRGPVVQSGAVARPLEISLQHQHFSSESILSSRASTLDEVDLKSTLHYGRITANLSIGSQTLPVVVNTGSPATWVFTSTSDCYDDASANDNCHAETTYHEDDTLHRYETNFTAAYGLGAGVPFEGSAGYANVTLGGIHIAQADIGLVDRGPVGLNINPTSYDQSGILGLFFTGEASGLTLDGLKPFYKSIFQQNIINHTIAIAASRDRSGTGDGGVLTFGGLPDKKNPSVNASGQWVTKDILEHDPAKYVLYWIDIDGYQLGTTMVLKSAQPYKRFFLDTGSPVLYLEDDTVRAVHAQFDPPGRNESTTWLVPCDARPPRFGIWIGGQTFYMNPVDMVYVDWPVSDGWCLSRFQQGDGVEGCLGLPFYHNVLVVHDLERVEMSFLAREWYSS